MTKEEEAKIIKKVIAGDTNAFEVLVSENQRIVYNVALKMLRNEEDALDISQEVFLKAYTSIASFKSSCRFSSWLYKITYNMCIDFKRKNDKYISVSLYSDSGELENEIYMVSKFSNNPEHIIERKELYNAINNAGNKLADNLKQILLLRIVNNMSYMEISNYLNLNVGTVKSRLNRARNVLIKNMCNDYGIDSIEEV